MSHYTFALTESSPHVTWFSASGQSRGSLRYGSGWIISGLVHGLLFVALLWGGGQILDVSQPTVRLMFVEPPPPPSTRLGPPVSEKVLPTPQQLPAIMEKPKPRIQAKPTTPKESARLFIVKKKKPREEPKPRQLEPATPAPPKVLPEPEATAPVAVMPPGMERGAANGQSKGEIGGVTSGYVVGVIGGQGTGPLPVSQVANPPLLLSRELPTHPRQARVRGVEGLVLLEAILDPEGRIENNIKVLQSIPSLDHAAVEALRRWRFQPARDRDNQPVRVILEVPVRFVLK